MSSSIQDRMFQLVGGHPALDLVNTLDWRFRGDGREELLATYGDLLSFCSQSQLLTTKQVRQIARSASVRASVDVLVACRELREAAAAVLYATVDDRMPSASQIKSLERYFKEARQHRRLVLSSPGLAWQWPATEGGAELPLRILSLSTEVLITSADIRRVRACEKPDCRWLFLDTSKNHTRRWCDMKICGNRMKARRFKALHGA
jgi:predicted RNA-binding Zn ribbon-like protein